MRLPTVTLIQIATAVTDHAEARLAQDQSMDLALFGAVKFLTAKDLPHVTDYESYNRFIVRELAQHFETDHCLLIQHDGFILNPGAWDEGFLDWDYIGAPWPNKEVGNGGFSLRSKGFCQASAALAESPEFKADGEKTIAEDVLLCGLYREELAKGEYQIRFAPHTVADRFSWELSDTYPEYTGAFGFHGQHTLERLTALKAQGKLGEFAEIPLPPNKWSA